ncbi:nitronate monooxygenase [Taibaiella lutea]|uniref:Nitronate monooxygenase n=1 Tax=Taibaiella lutea TaxID=2608001 RepID=A0A5M6CEV5_9BACT|nr:nitronate monooxygenase [Taibaiella lutea]KAA5533513.1 nitronate monooxygenase [Taibaiella lutea]
MKYKEFCADFGIRLPIIQAPMAGSDSVKLAIEVARAGGLGSLACALLTPDAIKNAVSEFRNNVPAPVNLNFFCHEMLPADPKRNADWKQKLQPYYEQLGINYNDATPTALRMPFDNEMYKVLEQVKPEIISFHFGLPEPGLLERVKATGAKIISSATTVAEAHWLEARGCDAVIAQGAEAGGHRASFLHSDPRRQVGTIALVPQVVDAVKIPVIAAGGISDARGIAAAFMLGASAVQLGTAYLFCPEAKVSTLYRNRLSTVAADETVITNLFSGRPARGILNRFVEEMGIISADAPAFPYASVYINPLRSKSEELQSNDFLQMWCGQGAELCTAIAARKLTEELMTGALALLGSKNE